MRYERVKVKRDTNTVHNRSVAPWETPILEFLFDEGNVERTGEFEEVVGRDYPSPAKELARLVSVYGEDPKNGVPYANMVYGNAKAGERSLAKLIAEAKSEDEAAAEEKAPIPAPTRKRSRSAAVDSLLG
jgi:hypothetical protein